MAHARCREWTSGARSRLPWLNINLTSVTDIVGFFTFLGLATWVASLLAASQKAGPFWVVG